MKNAVLLPSAWLLAACVASSELAAPGSPANVGVPGAASLAVHPFGVDDMLAMDRISDPQVSPDGKQVLFNVRVTDLAANRGRTDLWTVALAGGEPVRVTDHEASDVNGRWMPDEIVRASCRERV